MMKKILILLFICFATVLVGCVNTDLTLDIDKSGNANMFMKLLTNEYLANKITEEDLENIKKEYKIDSIKKISEDNESGYLLTKKLGNIALGITKEDEVVPNNQFIDIEENKGLIFNTYDVNLKLKDAMLGNLSDKDLAMFNLIGDVASMNFHVTSPFKLLQSNATSTVKENDGRTTYNWNYNLNTLENIKIKFRVPNIKNIIIIGGVVLVLFIISIVFIIKRKHKIS